MILMRSLLPVAGLILLCGRASANDAIVRQLNVAGNVYCLAYSPDGKVLAAQVGAQIYLWDTKTGQELRRIAEEPSPGVWSVVFSHDSKLVYAPLQDFSVASWDVATGKLVRIYKGHKSTVWSAAVSPDGKILASGGEDRTVRLWSTATGVELFQLPHTAGVWPFQFMRSGKELVSIASDGVLTVWDVTTGKERKQFATDNSQWPMALSSDGQTVASIRWQQTALRLWNLTLGKEVRTLETHAGTGWNLAFSPDGRTLAAGGPNNSLCLWESSTGLERLRLEGHQAKIDSIAFSPLASTVATAAANGKVIIWDVTGRLKDGNLTPARPTAAEFEALWKDIAGNDGVKAYRAVWTLAAAADRAVPFLRNRVGQLVQNPIDAAQVQKLINELDDNDFGVREKALDELGKFGTDVVPALRRALDASTSAEQTRRLKTLLDKLGPGAATPESIAGRRVVEVLEQIDTQASRQVLEQMLKSKAPAEVIEEARLALKRLQDRP